MRVAEHRLEEVGPVVAAAEHRRNAEPARPHRAGGEQHERDGDHPGRLVQVLALVLGAAELAVEDEEEQPERVERGHEGDQRADRPGELAGAQFGVEGHEQDLVLAEEAGQPGDAGDGQRGEQEGPVGDGQVAFQPAHGADVLLVVHGQDHRAAAEEQQRLEVGVGEQVEDAGRVGAHAAADEHVGQLADRGIGHHPLDVGLHQGDGGGEQGSERAEDGDQVERRLGQGEDRVASGHQEDAGGDHGGGVDEGAHRGRALHGVGQPDVQRQLGRFADGAAEEQDGDQGGGLHLAAEERCGPADERTRLAEDLAVVQAAEGDEDEQEPQEKAEVTEAVDNEGLLARVRGRLLLVVETDEQVGTESHRLPAEEQLEEVVAEHEHEHGEGEQAQVREEPVVAVLAFHVADRVDVHERTDAGDHDEHHRGQLVDQEADRHAQGAALDPGVQILVDDLAVLHAEKGEQRADKRGEHGDDRQPVGAHAHPPAEEQREDEGGQRQERDGEQ